MAAEPAAEEPIMRICNSTACPTASSSSLVEGRERQCRSSITLKKQARTVAEPNALISTSKARPAPQGSNGPG